MIIDKYIFHIYIFNPWKIFCKLRFHEVNFFTKNFMKPKVAEYFQWIKYIYIYISNIYSFIIIII